MVSSNRLFILFVALFFMFSLVDFSAFAQGKKPGAKKDKGAKSAKKDKSAEKVKSDKKDKKAKKDKKPKKGKKAAQGEDAADAAGEEEKDVSEKDQEIAEEYHHQAIKFYKEGQYKEAIERFLKAHELSPNPVSLFNIARAYQKMDQIVNAYDFYKQYIQTGDETRLEDAKEAIEKIESMPVVLKIATTPAGAVLLVDGQVRVGGETPVVLDDLKAGKHTIALQLEGYEDVEQEVDIPVLGEQSIEIDLQKIGEKPVAVEGESAGIGDSEIELTAEAKPKSKVKVSVGIGAGATVSTSEIFGSHIDASLAVLFRIKGGLVGIGIDNLIFSNSYLMAAYPAGGYRIELKRNLSLEFVAGFGVAYLHSSVEGGNDEGKIMVGSGGNWDLVAHLDAKLNYKVGPVLIQFIPVHVNVLTGVGSTDLDPLAQFAFLIGVAYNN